MTKTLAGIQIDVALGKNAENVASMQRWTARAKSEASADLVIFPECAVSGYCYESKEEAWEFAEPLDGPAAQAMLQTAREHNVTIVYGFLERLGDKLHNAANLVSPEGIVATYRKTHLPYLGVDRFSDFGDEPFQVHEVNGLRIGMLICYDGSFPEPSRVLALEGADIIVLPTNWPPGSGCTADCVPNARALENAVYFAAVNRVGTERGFAFVGKSRIVDPNGCVLLRAQEPPTEEMLVATIDPQMAREKHLRRVPGKHEIHRFRDRRPDLYERLTKPLHEGPIR